MAGLQVPCCKAELSAEAFLGAVEGYVSMTNSFAGRCPACGEFWEFQVRGGCAVFGYIYAAGSPHFEGMVDVVAPGLCVDGPSSAQTLRWGAFRWVPRGA